MRYDESLGAVHNLLQERQSIRQHLVMICNDLLVLSAHLNVQTPMVSLNNTVYLAKYVLQLLEAIRKKISLSSLWSQHISNNFHQSLLDFTAFSEGEELALEVFYIY